MQLCYRWKCTSAQARCKRSSLLLLQVMHLLDRSKSKTSSLDCDKTRLPPARLGAPTHQQRCLHPEGALFRILQAGLKCQVLPGQRNAFPFSRSWEVGGCRRWEVLPRQGERGGDQVV